MTIYKGCTIARSGSYTEVQQRNETRGRLRPLYDITGTVTKPTRPFITSVAEAKRYITQELEARAYARSAP